MALTWAEAFVEPSLDWQFLSEGDLEAVAELRVAIEYFDDPVEHRSLEQMRRDFHAPHSHPQQHSVVGRDKAGTIVAYAWNHPSRSDLDDLEVWLEIGVHPGWRHRKIGERLVDWSIERAKMWFEYIKARREQSNETVNSLRLTMVVDEGSRIQEDLVQNGTLKPQRWFFDMHRQIHDANDYPKVQLPEGFRIECFSKELSESVRNAHNLAFSTREGTKDISQEDWYALVNRPECREDWSWVVVHEPTGQIAGYIINSQLREEDHDVREGWTDMLGVVPEFRSQGIGANLLCSSIKSFAENGANFAGIGVDTENAGGSADLFSSLGYVSADRVVLYGASFRD